MIRGSALALVCALLAACSSTPPSGEDGGVTTDPSGSGATTLDTLDTLDSSDTEEPPDPTDDPDPTASTSTGWQPDLGPIPDVPDPGDPPDPGMSCTDDSECRGGFCYVIPFLGGYCGECKQDADCPDGGCTPPNPFDAIGSVCNMGEFGAGCETDAVCQDDLVCEEAFDLLGLIELHSCGTCRDDMDCEPGMICAATFDFAEWSGVRSCIPPGSVAQDGSCELESNGDQACASGICSVVDIMGLAEVGACGTCNTDLDCNGGTCQPGTFDLDSGQVTGSTCI